MRGARSAVGRTAALLAVAVVVVVVCATHVAVAAMDDYEDEDVDGQRGLDAQDAKVVFDQQDPYGRVLAVDTESVRFMVAGDTVVGAVFNMPGASKEEATFPCFAIMQAAASLTGHSSRRVLQLGLGAGTVPAFFANRASKVGVVEVNQAVVDAAAKLFDFPAKKVAMVVADALDVLQAPRTANSPLGVQRYDVIFHDLFSHSIPHGYDLMSQEILDLVKTKWLKTDGLFVMNMVGCAQGPAALSVRLVFQTLLSKFQHVRCFRDAPQSFDAAAATNLVFFAADHDIVFTIEAPEDPFPEFTSAWTLQHFQEWEVQLADISAYAPAADVDAGFAAHNAAMLKSETVESVPHHMVQAADEATDRLIEMAPIVTADSVMSTSGDPQLREIVTLAGTIVRASVWHSTYPLLPAWVWAMVEQK